eukprot:1564381-Rhodomonas_salina.2
MERGGAVVAGAAEVVVTEDAAGEGVVVPCIVVKLTGDGVVVGFCVPPQSLKRGAVNSASVEAAHKEQRRRENTLILATNAHVK